MIEVTFMSMPKEKWHGMWLIIAVWSTAFSTTHESYFSYPKFDVFRPNYFPEINPRWLPVTRYSIIRSSGPSEPEPSTALEWEASEYAVGWFVRLRKAVRSIVYRLCASINEAKTVLEECKENIYDNKYRKLCTALKQLLDEWRAFEGVKEMVTDLLEERYRLFRLAYIARFMGTPCEVTERMRDTCMKTRSIAIIIII